MDSNTCIEQLKEWLAAQSFSPPLRELAAYALLPAAAYPQLCILPQGQQHPGGAAPETALRLSLKLACAAGRPTDAQAQCRSLAAQIRRALLSGGHSLGGGVRHIGVGAISFIPPGMEHTPGAPVVASAEIEVEVLFIS